MTIAEQWHAKAHEVINPKDFNSFELFIKECTKASKYRIDDPECSSILFVFEDQTALLLADSGSDLMLETLHVLGEVEGFTDKRPNAPTTDTMQ